MSREDKDSLRNSEGNIVIMEMPEISKVVVMGFNEILKNLHLCPASDYFGDQKVKLNKADLTRN